VRGRWNNLARRGNRPVQRTRHPGEMSGGVIGRSVKSHPCTESLGEVGGKKFQEETNGYTKCWSEGLETWEKDALHGGKGQSCGLLANRAGISCRGRMASMTGGAHEAVYVNCGKWLGVLRREEGRGGRSEDELIKPKIRNGYVRKREE